jgi:hypothetical protein|tara:strand:+ start:5163 stop:5348 length:186 start_codon:yes stop_codon:yes gene_type:complete
MNPIWSVFFKDRFRTPFSVYKMSLAEIIVLFAISAGIGIAIAEGVRWVIDAESEIISIDDK